MEIQDIKRQLSILTVLAKYNLKPNKNNLLNCPFHNDKTASLQIYPKTNSFYCFACGATGDQIEFIEKYEKLDKHQAILKAKSMIPAATADTLKSNKTDMQPTRQPDYEELFLQFKQSLLRSTKAQEYLKQRGLEDLKEIGYNSGKFFDKLSTALSFR
jgi:DNA primase